MDVKRTPNQMHAAASQSMACNEPHKATVEAASSPCSYTREQMEKDLAVLEGSWLETGTRLLNRVCTYAPLPLMMLLPAPTGLLYIGVFVAPPVLSIGTKILTDYLVAAPRKTAFQNLKKYCGRHLTGLGTELTAQYHQALATLNDQGLHSDAGAAFASGPVLSSLLGIGFRFQQYWGKEFLVFDFGPSAIAASIFALVTACVVERKQGEQDKALQCLKLCAYSAMQQEQSRSKIYDLERTQLQLAHSKKSLETSKKELEIKLQGAESCNEIAQKNMDSAIKKMIGDMGQRAKNENWWAGRLKSKNEELSKCQDELARIKAQLADNQNTVKSLENERKNLISEHQQAVASSMQELKKKEDTIALKHNQIGKLRSDITSLQMKQHDAAGACEKLATELLEKQDRLKNLLSQMTSLQDNHKELQNSHGELEKQHTETTQLLKQQTDEIQNIQNNLQKQARELEKKNAEITELLNQKEQMEDNAVRQQNIIQNLEQANTEALQQKQQFRASYEETQQHLKEAQKEFTYLLSQAVEKEQQLQLLVQSREQQDAELQKKDSDINELHRQHQQLTDKLTSQQSLIKSLNEKCVKHQAQIDKCMRQTKQIAQAKENLGKMTKKLEALQGKYTSLKREKHEQKLAFQLEEMRLKNHIEESEKSLEKKTQALKQAQRKMARQCKNITSLNKENGQLKARLKLSERDRQQTRQELERLNQHLKEKNIAIQELEHSIRVLESDVTERIVEIGLHTDSKKQQFDKKLTALAEDLKDKEDQLFSLKQKMAQLKRDFGQLQDEKFALNTALQNSQQMNKNLADRASEYKRDKQALEILLAEKDKRVLKQKGEIEEINAQLQELQMNKVSTRNLEDTIRQLQSNQKNAVGEYSSAIRKLEENLSQKTDEHARLLAEKKALETQLATLEDDNIVLTEDARTRNERHNRQILEAQEELAQKDTELVEQRLVNEKAAQLFIEVMQTLANNPDALGSTLSIFNETTSGEADRERAAQLLLGCLNKKVSADKAERNRDDSGVHSMSSTHEEQSA